MTVHDDQPFLLATRNRHKTNEIAALLSGLGRFRIMTLNEVPGLPELSEDGLTFAENATQKAEEVRRFLVESAHPLVQSGGYVLADDSGLEVDALDGQPGVFSARFALLDSGQTGNASDSDNNAKLLRLLRSVPVEKRTARFKCVLALLRFPDPSTLNLFDGACEGRIIETILGDGGFGYDPLFVPNEDDKTFAELPSERKNQISHRANALRKLKSFFASRKAG